MKSGEQFENAERTLTLCPVCLKVLDGRIFPSGGDMHISARCAVHGEFQSLYFRDSRLYNQVSRLVDRRTVCRELRCARMEPCKEHLKQTYNIMVDLTMRCNLECPVCFADAGVRLPEPTPEDIFARLPRKKANSCQNVVLLGGEPTLREDLPQLIRGIAERGLIPRLSTNGLRLADMNYLLRLKDAGLKWVVLQFDGVNDEVYIRLRGRPLLKEKLKILANCQSAGMAVQLAVMVDKESNGDQLGEIIRLGFETPVIKWVNFYPRTPVNRDRLDGGSELHVADMFGMFEQQTGGRLRRGDFLSMMKTLRRFHQITGREIFRQKLSTYPMVLVKTPDGIVPLPRLFGPLGAIRNSKAAAIILRHLPKLWNFQDLDMPSDVLFMTMEKFHTRYGSDLCEASCCHMAFMVRQGFVPFDVYNFLYRQTPNW